ncbi:tissue factor-like isoform X2 [Parambassis ranga]|uniref:Tissue factor n=1 Tax=Parambassis ranga TaxID=210632 RepID=A0A6P7K4G3_9TELE|nr:tissue factor-like isoform X2 [Parambassis ranga]
MASLKTLLYLGICLSARRMTNADENSAPKADKVRWVSVDFTTSLIWNAKPSDYTFTVLYSADNSDWTESPDCIDISETECDLTNHLIPLDRMYSADIKTEPPSTVDIDPDELPHTYSPLFNPYRESNISALKFTVESVRDGRVTVNITDPVTSIHKHGKQLSIRDILKNDLKYKISYYKSGSTGKRDIIFASSMANISGLDAGHSYCFMVAAFIPSRPKPSQHGVWSTQVCTSSNETVLKDLSFEAWIGVAFILLAALIIIITVSVLCCRQRNKMLRTSQTSAPI